MCTGKLNRLLGVEPGLETIRSVFLLDVTGLQMVCLKVLVTEPEFSFELSVDQPQIYRALNVCQDSCAVLLGRIKVIWETHFTSSISLEPPLVCGLSIFGAEDDSLLKLRSYRIQYACTTKEKPKTLLDTCLLLGLNLDGFGMVPH